MHALFDKYAHRYDLHTPPDHYRHDHAFVLEVARTLGNPCRLLDVGCGTGVLLEKALKAGMLAHGIDVSREMVRVAGERVGHAAVSHRPMQQLDDAEHYDLIVALSWSLNYCSSREELVDVLRRMRRALRSGGRVMLQVAHAAHVDGTLMEDRECGPAGERDDVTLLYRFARICGDEPAMRAEYVYACKSANELLYEEHVLRVADAELVEECAREVGFGEVSVYDSWRRDAFRKAASPFVCAVKGSSPA